MGSKLGQMIVEVLLCTTTVFSLQPKMEKIIKPLEGNWVGTIV